MTEQGTIPTAQAAYEAAIRADERARIIAQLQAAPAEDFEDFELKMEPFSMTRLAPMVEAAHRAEASK